MLRHICSRYSRVLPRLQARTLATQTDANTKKTALYDEHVKLGGKMVPFAGYWLPVQFKDGVLQNHLHVRNSAGVFDVSHMGQLRIHGKKRLQFLESLVVGDLVSLKQDQARLSMLTNEQGGILDDCVITNKTNHVYMVVNGACKHTDMAHMKKHLEIFNKKEGADVKMEYCEDRSLLALQGPKAAEILSRMVKEDLSSLQFMYTREMKVAGLDCWVSRCGYTGEDGFEISVASTKVVDLLNAMLKHKEVLPAGLGVRDSLRLEAGLCLYGHDLNETITPIEAGLGWTISKRRRTEGGFPGYDVIKRQIEQGVSRKRVGLLVKKGAPAREGAIIKSKSGQNIGTVTSGTFSPSLNQGIAMGYIAPDSSAVGTQIAVEVRGKVNDAEVVKMPFVPARYFKPAGSA